MVARGPSDCVASHPRHQRGWARWLCPLCQSPLRRDLVAADAHSGCQRMHSDDQFHCTGRDCPFFALGNFVARLVATSGVNRACPTCSGRGYAPAKAGQGPGDKGKKNDGRHSRGP